MVIEKRKYLKGLDGRRLKIRSKHSALNMLLQSAGSILTKKATVLFWDKLTSNGFKFGSDVAQVAHVHDEWQCLVREGLEETVGEISVQAIKDAGVFFNLNLPMDGDWKVGNNWAETH